MKVFKVPAILSEGDPNFTNVAILYETNKKQTNKQTNKTKKYPGHTFSRDFASPRKDEYRIAAVLNPVDQYILTPRVWEAIAVTRGPVASTW